MSPASFIDYLFHFLSDVVGGVENLEAMVTIETRYGPKQLVRFSVSDGRLVIRILTQKNIMDIMRNTIFKCSNQVH